jgi:hypothetical protein
MSELCRWTLGIVGALLALLLLRIGFGDRIAGSRSGGAGPLAAWQIRCF